MRKMEHGNWMTFAIFGSKTHVHGAEIALAEGQRLWDVNRLGKSSAGLVEIGVPAPASYTTQPQTARSLTNRLHCFDSA